MVDGRWVNATSPRQHFNYSITPLLHYSITPLLRDSALRVELLLVKSRLVNRHSSLITMPTVNTSTFRLVALLFCSAALACWAADTPNKSQYGAWGFDSAGSDTSTKPGDDFF